MILIYYLCIFLCKIQPTTLDLSYESGGKRASQTLDYIKDNTPNT